MGSYTAIFSLHARCGVPPWCKPSAVEGKRPLMRLAVGILVGIGLGGVAVGVAAGAAAPGASLRTTLLAAPIDARLGGDTTIDDQSELAYTLIAPNAPEDEQRLFAFGNRVFGMAWDP